MGRRGRRATRSATRVDVSRPPAHRRSKLAVPAVVVALAVAAPFPLQALDTAEREPRDLETRGGEVFQANCAACHGTRGEGGAGDGVLAGPPIQGLDIAYVDLTVRTGRMPIALPAVGVHADQLDDEDREALLAYVRARFEVHGELPTVGLGDASRGQELYVRNCAACHGAAAGGGISGASVHVPQLVGVDGVAIHEATRVGPFEMPAFDEAVLSDDDIADIVGYLELVRSTPRSAIGLREVDRAMGGVLAAVLGLSAGAVLLVVARARRWYRFEPDGYHEDPPFEPRR